VELRVDTEVEMSYVKIVVVVFEVEVLVDENRVLVVMLVEVVATLVVVVWVVVEDVEVEVVETEVTVLVNVEVVGMLVVLN